MRYKTELKFKGAIEGRLNIIISNKAWKLLSEVLFAGCIHAPYSDGDVEFAIEKLNRLKGYVE